LDKTQRNVVSSYLTFKTDDSRISKDHGVYIDKHKNNLVHFIFLFYLKILFIYLLSMHIYIEKNEHLITTTKEKSTEFFSLFSISIPMRQHLIHRKK
jgi:hypothetical protein